MLVASATTAVAVVERHQIWLVVMIDLMLIMGIASAGISLSFIFIEHDELLTLSAVSSVSVVAVTLVAVVAVAVEAASYLTPYMPDAPTCATGTAKR